MRICLKMYVIQSKKVQVELAVYKSNTSKNCGPDKKNKKPLRKEVMALKEGSAVYCCLGEGMGRSDRGQGLENGA